MISIKSEREIELMRIAGDIVARAHKVVRESVRVGLSLKKLDLQVEKFILSCNAEPVFKGYNGFPSSICASLNEIVVHGIPSTYKLRDGDIISVDIGVKKDGFCSDMAETYLVGNVAEETKKLVRVTEECFEIGLKECYAGNRISNIGNSIQMHAESHGYGVIRELVGHGVGANLHEEPQVPNYGPRDQGMRLKKGMTIAIEPMITMGDYEVETAADGWTVYTTDRSLSSHHERTILITDGEPEILSKIREV